jgi:hypothetical protein
MAHLLMWKDGEGYDIHVLRNQVSSKALDSKFDIDPNFPLSQFPLEFEPHFKGAPNAQGVQVDTTTGVVTASPAPAPNLRNFLMTARQTGTNLETVIRVHIHDSINRIWLTPPSLTTHEGADECRFTVLAQFDDDTIGDITEWPQLSYSVSNPLSLPPSAIAVHVSNAGDDFSGEKEAFGGRLQGRVIPGETPDQPHDVVVTLPRSSPPGDLTATAQVFTLPSWSDVAKDPSTQVRWVAGPQVPNSNDPTNDKPDSIGTVVKGRANILFISDGFINEDDFRKKVVEATVKELRTQDPHQPFKLLSGSINYWSVFVPSKQEAVSILGDNEIFTSTKRQSASAVPLPAAPTQPQWDITNMINEAGLPLPHDPPVADASAWPNSRASFFDIPATASVDAISLSNWNDLKQRTLLNERNTAFGMAHHDRPRASGQDLLTEERLMHDPRRTSEASIKDFVTNLQFNGFNIGATWDEQTGPDFGRVCFVCQSMRSGGTAIRTYFTASTGQARGADVVAATIGTDVKPQPIGTSFSIPIFATVVSHECGHALGLGDEYGAPSKFTLGQDPLPDGPNLQPDTFLAPIDPTTGLRTFDTSKIKWLWPRVSKAGVLVGPPDFQGAADPIQFLIHLRSGDGKPFAKDDLVRIREAPVHRAPASDPFAGILLRIDLPVRGDDISVEYVNTGGPHVDLTLFNPSKQLLLVCTSIKPNKEFSLVADPILNQITISNGPLNAPKGSVNAGCTPGAPAVITPTNLPKLSKSPPVKQDIVGIYEGGGYHDCGVFRPAGRCRMRGGFDFSIPFCHVCRYVIVDAIDPTRHGDLDSKLYDKVYPT